MSFIVNLKFFKSYKKVIKVINIYFNIIWLIFLKAYELNTFLKPYESFYAWRGQPVNKFLMACV